LEQMDLKATELDKMTCSYDLQMLKAALTYFPPQPKRFLSLFIKVQELKNTFRLVSASETAGFLNICSTPESTPKQGFFDIWNEIKDYGSPEQQKMFDRLSQAIQLSSMYEQMQAASGNTEQPDTPPPRATPEEPSISSQEEELSQDLAAASLSDTPPVPGTGKEADFRTCIRNSLSPENQALFDSYSAMFHSQKTFSEKET
jgi:hypothetical protein